MTNKRTEEGDEKKKSKKKKEEEAAAESGRKVSRFFLRVLYWKRHTYSLTIQTRTRSKHAQ